LFKKWQYDQGRVIFVPIKAKNRRQYFVYGKIF